MNCIMSSTGDEEASRTFLRRKAPTNSFPVRIFFYYHRNRKACISIVASAAPVAYAPTCTCTTDLKYIFYRYSIPLLVVFFLLAHYILLPTTTYYVLLLRHHHHYYYIIMKYHYLSEEE
jgi:hypothetical protein